MISDFREEYIKSLVGDFISTIEEKNKDIEQAIAEGNVKDAASSAHSIASMAATIGLDNTCDMYRKVEARINDESINMISLLYNEALNTYFAEREAVITERSLG